MISTLTEDHQKVENAFNKFENGQLATQQRRDLADHIITELVRHSVAEEQYLYPTARKTLANGDQVADHEIAEHTEAERLMKQLENADPTSPEFTDLGNQLIAAIRHHVHDEENDLFPKLREACDPRQLAELGEKIQQTKQTAPTRPHPNAPDRPPMNKALAPGAGLVDRVRDALNEGSH